MNVSLPQPVVASRSASQLAGTIFPDMARKNSLLFERVNLRLARMKCAIFEGFLTPDFSPIRPTFPCDSSGKWPETGSSTTTITTIQLQLAFHPSLCAGPAAIY